MNKKTQHITYYNNRLAVSAGWMFDDAEIITESNYKWYVRSNKINILRNGGGAGRTALVEYESLPDKYKQKIIKVLGQSPYELYKSHWFEQYLMPDHKARAFFETYITKSGKPLPEDKINEYSIQVQFLNALNIVKKEKKSIRKIVATNEIFDFWQRISDVINNLQDKYQHNLPSAHGALRNKFTKYRKEGAESIISGKYGNSNNLKAYPQVIKAILSLYVTENLPFADRVHKYYTEFLDGKREIVDTSTGEVLLPNEFIDQKGKRLDISESLVKNIINSPKYEDLIDSLRSDYSKYKLNSSQYNRRKLPQYSMSKISIDDRRLAKLADGTEAWIYAAYEPLSQCFVSVAYDNQPANNQLVMEMFRELYRNSIKHGIYWAGEIEHEHHLMEGFTKMMDTLFAYRRACNPSNSKEKRIEHGFKVLKYGAEKEVFDNVGRWYGKAGYKNKEGYKEKRNYKEYVADHKRAVELHNNSEHPTFKGKTRWQVLMENMNPELSMPVGFRVLKHIGYKTQTSIQRSDFVQVQYQDYLIDRNKMHLLKPYNKNVDAYWLPDENGIIQDVYIYQDDTFISKGKLAERYNEAQIERTDRDEQIRTEQAKHLQKHLKYRNKQKEDLIFKPVMIDVDFYEDAKKVIAETNEEVIVETKFNCSLTDEEILKKAQSYTDYAEELANENF